jgi:hypothetical protein
MFRKAMGGNGEKYVGMMVCACNLTILEAEARGR